MSLEQCSDAVRDRLRGVRDRHRFGVLTVAVAHFDGAVVDGVAAGDGDDRHADEFGVLELDARRHLLAVVEDDFDALGLKLTDQLFCGFERGRILPVATTCTCAGAMTAGHARPFSS